MPDQRSLASSFVFRRSKVLAELLGRQCYLLSLPVSCIRRELLTSKVRELEF